jgi:hypothetical protein
LLSLLPQPTTAEIIYSHIKWRNQWKLNNLLVNWIAMVNEHVPIKYMYSAWIVHRIASRNGMSQNKLQLLFVNLRFNGTTKYNTIFALFVKFTSQFTPDPLLCCVKVWREKSCEGKRALNKLFMNIRQVPAKGLFT